MSTDAMPNGESDLYPVELLTISFPLSFSSFNPVPSQLLAFMPG